MLDHYKKGLPLFELAIERLMAQQVLDRDSRYYGVTEDVTNGYTEPTAGAGIASSLITAYYTPGIKWYRDDEVLERAKAALEQSLREQHEDGTLDLMTTNFHDSTVCGFTMQGVGPAYQLMLKYTKHTPKEDELDAMFRTFVTNCGEAMTNCGFHTPNHRWVVSASLSLCYNIIGDERYLNHLKKFLAEGIDCDENGEFTERSVGVYNVICDRSLMILAKQLDMPELLEHVTRNLYLVMKFIEPDGTLNTMNSTRQDFGTDPNFGMYYDCFFNAAVMTGNTEFAYMADHILELNMAANTTKVLSAAYMSPGAFLLDEGLEAKMLALGTSKPDYSRYEALYPDTGVMRHRIGDATLTLIKDRPTFAKLQYNDKRMMVRFAGSFFGPLAQFKGQTLEACDGGYKLTYHQRWGYKRPLEVPQGTSDWHKMDHSKRENVTMQDFDVSIWFKLADGELTIELDAGGCERIPLKLELIFDAGGVYCTPDCELTARKGDYVYLKKGSAEYKYPDKVKYIIEGGFYGHHYGKNMRGSIPGEESAFSVVMSGFTPEKKTVKVRYGGITLK